jgi:hypothetical protein
MHRTDGDQISCMIVYFLVLEQIYEVAKTGGPYQLILFALVFKEETSMADRDNILHSGDALSLDRQQDSVFSPLGGYQLKLQSDGNLVLYKLEKARPTPLWASHTNGREVGQCIMQADGNLVIYTPDHTPIWASHTNGHHGSHLEVQDDGNVVIYTPDPNRRAIWATNTQGR